MKFIRQLRALFRKEKLDAEMAEEMRAHLELQAAENERRGMDAAEARFAAQREFGGVEQIKERARDRRGWPWLEGFTKDLHYAVRSLRKHPGFTAVAVLTLALGIGVNSTTFSVINDLIVRPFLRDRQQHLVALHIRRADGARNYRAFNYAEFTALRATTGIFSDVAAMQFGLNLVGRGDDVQRRLLCLVSQNYFALLGVRPWRGRFFTAAEADPAAGAPVVVASYDLWQRMGGREDFVGGQVWIDGGGYTVIGIAPAGFGGLQFAVGPDAWLPLGQLSTLTGVWGSRAPGGRLLDPRSYVLQLFGDLRPGLTLAAARGELAPLSARLNALAGAGATELRELTLTVPSRGDLDLTWPADEGGLGIYAIAAVGMTITVLLVACLNVANMLFGRGISRQKEIAIRLCLGASRGRVVRQLLVEGLLLAVAGGVAGLLLSRWVNSLLLEFGSRHAGSTVLHLRTTFDWPLLAGTFALCLLATVAVSLAPAWRATRRNLVDDLKKQGGEPAAMGRWNRFFSFRHGLVMIQIALSLVLLFSASLLVRAVLNSERDRGFATDDRIVANLDYFLAKTPQASVPLRQRALLTRVAGLPGVENAALASAVPYNFETNWQSVFPIGAGAGGRGAAAPGDNGHYGVQTIVSHGYFTTMGIPLLRGRDFTEAETRQAGGRRVAIIDESLGRLLFGDDDPLGRHVALGRSEADGQHRDREIEIVGVVRGPREDAHQHEVTTPRLYRPCGQVPGGMLNTYLHVKLAPGAAMPAMIDTLRRELRALDPDTPLLVCEPLAGFVAKNLNVWSLRALAILFALFGLIAVVLAVVGVYGVKAYLVACRTREIGVRIAIGARPADVLMLFLRQSVLQAAVGISAGLVLAVVTGQFLAKLLYRVSPFDPIALTGTAGLLALVSTVACLLPAWRATRVNPTEALRAE